MILEGYGPEVVHIKGVHNVVANAMSRLDIQAKLKDELPDEGKYPKLEYAYVNKKDISQRNSQWLQDCCGNNNRRIRDCLKGLKLMQIKTPTQKRWWKAMI